jgi:hypothetical protein
LSRTAKADNGIGDNTDKLWSNGCAQVTASRHQGKDKHASRGDFVGCDDKASRPHHCHAKPRRCASNQPENGQGGNDANKIANGCAYAAEEKHLFDVLSAFCV